MNIKEWLGRAYKIDQQIKSKQEQIETWVSLATKIGSIGTAAPSGGGHSNKIEHYVAKIVDATDEVEKQLSELISVKCEIGKLIQRISNITSRILLEQRYLVCKSWADIADFMCYNEQYIKQDLHRAALFDANQVFSYI